MEALLSCYFLLSKKSEMILIIFFQKILILTDRFKRNTPLTNNLGPLYTCLTLCLAVISKVIDTNVKCVQHNFWYRRPSLFTGLLFAVLIIRGFIFISKNLLSAIFPLIIRGFSCKLPEINNFLAITVFPCYLRFWYPQDSPRT